MDTLTLRSIQALWLSPTPLLQPCRLSVVGTDSILRAVCIEAGISSLLWPPHGTALGYTTGHIKSSDESRRALAVSEPAFLTIMVPACSFSLGEELIVFVCYFRCL